MATPPDKLFNEDDLDRINTGLARLDVARSLIDQAKQAGFDVGNQERQATEQRDRLLKIKNTFFPGR